MSETLFLQSSDTSMSGILANRRSCKGLEKTKKKFGTVLCRNSDLTHDLSLKLLQFTVCGTLGVTVYCDRRLPGKSRPLRK